MPAAPLRRHYRCVPLMGISFLCDLLMCIVCVCAVVRVYLPRRADDRRLFHEGNAHTGNVHILLLFYFFCMCAWCVCVFVFVLSGTK